MTEQATPGPAQSRLYGASGHVPERILLAARSQASTAPTAAVNTLKALILGAPDDLRQQLRGLNTPKRAGPCRTGLRHRRVL